MMRLARGGSCVIDDDTVVNLQVFLAAALFKVRLRSLAGITCAVMSASVIETHYLQK
jgi:hypothetical protein